MQRVTLAGLALSGLLAASPALADMHAVGPAGGGLAALDVRVDLARAVVVANGVEVPIVLDRAQLPTEDEVTLAVVAIGQGKHVAHVRVPAHGSDATGPAWEAILAAGRPHPIFARPPRFVAGHPPPPPPLSHSP